MGGLNATARHLLNHFHPQLNRLLEELHDEVPDVQKHTVLFVTVATHREPYIDLLVQSATRRGIDLRVLGTGESFKGTFRLIFC